MGLNCVEAGSRQCRNKAAITIYPITWRDHHQMSTLARLRFKESDLRKVDDVSVPTDRPI